MGKRWEAFKSIFRPKVVTNTIIRKKSYPNEYGSGGEKYNNGLYMSGESRLLSHFAIRQNVRSASLDSLFAKGLMTSTVDSCVGTGLELKSTPNVDLLGISPEAADTWANKVEQLWRVFANSKEQHRSGTMTFNQMQRLYCLMDERDGENFVRLYYSKSPKRPFNVQFEIYDPNQIRGFASTSTYAQHYQNDGIERNADGTEKSYKIWRSDPVNNGKHIDETVPRIGSRSKRVMMIHGFSPEYAGQGRGFSRYVVILQDLERITTFKLAIIEKAINQAVLIMSVENMQQDGGNPLASVTPAEKLSLMGASTAQCADSVTTTEETPPITHLDKARPPIGGIALVNNEQGNTTRMLENTAPADEFDRFVGFIYKDIATSIGRSIEFVQKQFGENYSASRAALHLMWEKLKVMREEMASDLNTPLYEVWLGELIASGMISAPGWSDPILRSAWSQCRWVGSAIPSIDPAKEAKARKDNLEMHLTTQQIEANNLNGSDANANMERNRKMFGDMPIPPWSAAYAAEAGGDKADEPEVEYSDDGKEDKEDDK